MWRNEALMQDGTRMSKKRQKRKEIVFQ